MRQGLVRLLHLVRYRFFVVAGVLPYLLGTAAAGRFEGVWRADLFVLGLAGIVAALAAVEAFNEYFDSQTGNDVVFAKGRRDGAPEWHLWLGLASLFVAALLGMMLVVLRGWWVLVFAAAGGLAIVSYVGPPLRLAYRGFGEATIAASCGPLMVSGAYYLQSGTLRPIFALVSLPVAVLVAALAVANEIPDYYQDRLVDKRNIAVRFGRRGAAVLVGVLLALGYVSVILGMAVGAVPRLCAALLLSLPIAYRPVVRAVRQSDRPEEFVAVIRGAALLFTATAVLMTAGYVWAL